MLTKLVLFILLLQTFVLILVVFLELVRILSPDVIFVILKMLIEPFVHLFPFIAA